MQLEEMQVGDQIEGFYVLQSAVAKTTVSGKPMLSMVLSDVSGSMDAVAWDYAGPVSPQNAGSVIKIRGSVSEYKGTRQITAERLRAADANDRYSTAELVPTAPVDAEAAWQELQALAASLEDEDYAAVCRLMLERWGAQLRTIPAAKSVHHGFRHGLLMHTLNMLRTADFLAALYADTVDRSLLLAGTLLHDIAKAEEFTFSPLGLAADYSVKGQLLGHLVMGAQAVAAAAAELGIPEEKSVLLQHMLLSHHGAPEYGAAVRPMCAESELLSYIDLIDSRMEIYRETMAEVPAGQFSKCLYALEKRIYHHD